MESQQADIKAMCQQIETIDKKMDALLGRLDKNEKDMNQILSAI